MIKKVKVFQKEGYIKQMCTVQMEHLGNGIITIGT